MNGYYDVLFQRARQRGLSAVTAAGEAAHALLDGKPSARGRHKVSNAERLAAFFSADFLSTLPAEAWAQEPMVLVLARYLGQDRLSLPDLISQLAACAPLSLRRAARYAGVVSRQDSPRRREIEALALTHPHAFGEFVQVLRVFDEARRQRWDTLEQARRAMQQLSPLAILVHASLYAFEHLIPAQLEGRATAIDPQEAWDAFDAILAWKLATCDPADLRLDEPGIAYTLRAHLSPLLFPSPEQPPRLDQVRAFAELVALQIEWNGFLGRSADAFSLDDSIRFVREGERLEIVEIDTQARADWQRDGHKLERLHRYWLYRGMDALQQAPELLARIHPEQVESQLQAFAKTQASWLRLQEVYGVAEQVRTDGGLPVDVFGALLATELMTAFYIDDFLRPFHQHLQQAGHPWMALGRLALAGLALPVPQNRFPVTWSTLHAKAARITPWTASARHPQGHLAAAHAVLDFWTSDWVALAEQLRRGDTGLAPRLTERPVLKMGGILVQLPWLLATQNNTTAAINNLRRLGARRHEARAETQRIEQRLGTLFAERGFQVLVGHEPARAAADGEDAGEIDLLCACDGQLLVLELKSSFVRRSQRDAWNHCNTTLRKAGRQLTRKLQAVDLALRDANDPLRQRLGLAAQGMPAVRGWIVDTSIECDHQRFDGFLKVSLEEVLIALRDERHLLNDPEGLFRVPPGPLAEQAPGTLYPEGFSAARFIDCVESGGVWATDEPP